MDQRNTYPSDLTDKEWEVLEKLVPGDSKLGRPARYPKREILNSIFYIVRSGCAWRMMPPRPAAVEDLLLLLYEVEAMRALAGDP